MSWRPGHYFIHSDSSKHQLVFCTITSVNNGRIGFKRVKPASSYIEYATPEAFARLISLSTLPLTTQELVKHRLVRVRGGS